MRIKFTATSALVLTSIASLANASTEINIGKAVIHPYARAVAGVEYVDNLFYAGIAGSKTEIASNQWGTSYAGVSAQFPMDEDLTAVANLEGGFGTDYGKLNTADTIFDRKANVGLKHEKFGELSFGTHLNIAQDIEDMDPMQFQSIGLNSISNGVNDGSSYNSVQYRTATYAGFSLGYMHHFGGIVGDQERGSGEGVSAAYAYGPFKIRGIYNQQRDRFGRYSGGAHYGLGSQDQWLNAKNSVIATSYDFGPAKLMVGYENVEAPGVGYNLAGDFDDNADIIWGGINYNVMDKMTALAGVYQLEQDKSGKKPKLYAAGVNYDWNQYVTLYTTIGYVTNNKISSVAIQDAGASNHALSYNDAACENAADCNGASQFGGYMGIAVKM